LLAIVQIECIAQGLRQFTWRFVGGVATGQAAYHGTKLLGGSEETAQMMNLFGNLVGGAYAAYKAANKFSLNKVSTDPREYSYNMIENPELPNECIEKLRKMYKSMFFPRDGLSSFYILDSDATYMTKCNTQFSSLLNRIDALLEEGGS
jgi:hypothetical protein